jgi:hypothetical protein
MKHLRELRWPISNSQAAAWQVIIGSESNYFVIWTEQTLQKLFFKSFVRWCYVLCFANRKRCGKHKKLPVQFSLINTLPANDYAELLWWFEWWFWKVNLSDYNSKLISILLVYLFLLLFKVFSCRKSIVSNQITDFLISI